jgi:heme-degrading monooxygenase HmoA
LDSTSTTTLAITKVKKPWYAWRGLIIKKMEESIPEYRLVKGLQQKFYSFTEDHKLFGGIYFWQSEADAKSWFNQAWYDKIEKKYGKKGIVDFYKVQKVNSFANAPSQKNKCWSVLTYSNTAIGVDISTKGILKEIHLTSSANEKCYLTIWKDKQSADDFFKNKKLRSDFFDSPVFINNSK